MSTMTLTFDPRELAAEFLKHVVEQQGDDRLIIDEDRPTSVYVQYSGLDSSADGLDRHSPIEKLVERISSHQFAGWGRTLPCRHNKWRDIVVLSGDLFAVNALMMYGAKVTVGG